MLANAAGWRIAMVTATIPPKLEPPNASRAASSDAP